MIRCGQPQLGQRERDCVAAVLDSGQLSLGEWNTRFACQLSHYLGRSVTPVSSGTAALHIALLAVGVQPGDEVIVPATTFVATVNAVLYCGARPVVVDVDPHTWTLDPGNVELALTERTAAVVPVHLYGVPAEPLTEPLREHYRRTGRRVAVVEDCAEGLGAEAGGAGVGRFCDAAAFSFYSSKTITTGGEGGAVAWSDRLVGDRAGHLPFQAMTDARYWHDCLGFNYRMTELQAAVGVAQFERLSEFLERRRQIFAWYDERLPADVTKQAVRAGDTHGMWAYAVTLPMLHFGVARRLEDHGIETRPIFPPVCRFPHVGMVCETPVADRLYEHGLVLPTHCGLTERDVDEVCRALSDA